jgi:hypothetical protein
MKVQASQIGDIAATAALNVDGAKTARRATFERVLASAATEPETAAKKVEPRTGETFKPVDGRAFVDVEGGKRSGMYVNTSGNERHGEAFVLVRKHGREFHIYGSGKDRLVVAVKPPAERKPEAAAGDDGLKLRRGETIEPVEGRPYAEITSGARSGMYINTGDNDRRGEAFVLANRGGVEYHIYGSGKDREVVPVRRREDDERG